jgi:hypothetical protein
MKLSDAYPSRYLKADDLDGKNVTVTIKSAELEEFDKKRKLVLSFVGTDKQLICNKINASTIAKLLHSEETDDWTGQRITLCTRETEFQGSMVLALRVLEQKPAAQKAAAPPPPPPAQETEEVEDADSDDIPF